MEVWKNSDKITGNRAETKINEPHFDSFPAKTTLYKPCFESGTRINDTKTKLSDNRKSRFHYLCVQDVELLQ